MISETRPAERTARCSLFAVLLALALPACEADDPRVTTIIGDRAVVTFARPLCRGDITLIERTIDHVEDHLDVRVESPIEIFLWSRYDDVAARCSEGPTGCYIDGEVHGLWQSLEHELVHAVAAPLGTPEPLWLEGIAEALSGRTNQGQEDVGSLIGLEDSRQVDYTTAGHFTRWLLEGAKVSADSRGNCRSRTRMDSSWPRPSKTTRRAHPGPIHTGSRVEANDS